MPSSVPYDHPSLVLGNIVDIRVLDLLKKINACQNSVDAAQDKLNSLIMMRRSIAMTINELSDMNVDITAIAEKQPELDARISAAAADYLSARMDNETDIQQQREQLGRLETGESLESPLDFSASVLQSFPLSAASLKLDSQYFSFGNNMQDDTLASIEKFVRSNTSNLGAKSGELTSAVSSQVSSQVQNHSIAGTLIIMANCTHSHVRMFQPLVIDPDKALSTWNTLNGAMAKIDVETLKAANAGKEAPPSANAPSVSLISGASYGSSFIGMVHILNSDTTAKGDMDKLKRSLDEKLRIGGWLQNSAGGFGIDESIMGEVRAFLSTQAVSAHISIVTMGVVPSIKANALSLGVSMLSVPDTGIATAIATEAGAGPDTLNSEAEKSRANARIVGIQNARTQSLIKGLAKIDQQNNKVLDINSLMNAFDSYITSVQSPDAGIGVPVNFYLKKLDKQEIEKLWIDKYYPEDTTAGKADARGAATKEGQP